MTKSTGPRLHAVWATCMYSLGYILKSQASEQESVMVNREHGNSRSDEQECVAVMNSYLAGRINDPVAHGK